MEGSKTVVIIPAFNEEKTIFNVVASIKNYSDVILVNDASSDNTLILAKKAGAIVVNLNKNCGYDEALNHGFKKANELSYKYAITIDADGQHDVSFVKKYINLLETYDLVLGIRPKYQRLSEKIYSVFTKKLFAWHDPLCGMKGYKMEIYTNLGYFDSLGSIGTELAMFGILNRYKTKQIHIPLNDRIDQPRFHSIYRANLIILKAMFKVLIKYRKQI